MFVSQASRLANPAANNDVLAPQHVQYLKDRAVDPDWAVFAGVRTISSDEGARLLGYPLGSGGLLVPYPNAPGYVRVRLDDGGGYRVPANGEVPIYIPQHCELEGNLPLFVVEGPVKALALQDHGFNTIALGGVATTLKKDHTLNDSWRQVALVRREVVLLFDANRANNFEVARAEARLALALEQAGAKVRVAALPLREGGADQGPDDFVAAHEHDVEPLVRIASSAAPADPVERAKRVGTNDEALELLENLPFLVAIKERGVVVQAKVGRALRAHGINDTLLRRALKEAEAKKRDTSEEPVSPGAMSSWYEVREGGFCRVYKPDGATEVAERLCNFAAHIVEDRALDDGSEQLSRHFVLEGMLCNGNHLPRISVSPQEFTSDTWVTQHWGARAIVGADIARPAHHLLNAIKAVSQSVATTAYGHTGFRKIDGDWMYLHGAGAIGNANVLIDLNGGLARFALPETVDDARTAVTHSLDFIEVAAERITRPLLAAVYRAPLNEVLSCDAAVALYGGSGSLKSTVAALAQSHYGAFEYNSLPLSWESTANSLELALFRGKDVVVTIDDYVPKANQFDEIYRKAERVLRAIGNGSARGRLRSDTSERPDRPCRALVVITGEDLPKGESLQARLVAISMKRDDVALAKITTLQAAQHRLPHATRAYIEWLRPRMSELKTEVLEKYRELRGQVHLAGQHLRAPSAIAHLLVGAYYFGEFAKDVGVMTDAQAKAHVEATRSALLENARDQARATAQSNPARRFVEVLRSLYVGGRFSLKPTGTDLEGFTLRGLPEIGWKDGTHAYFLPDATLSLVNAELKAMGEGQPLQAYGLWKRMADEEFIEATGKEVLPKVAVGKGKARVRCLKMPLSVLAPPTDPEPDEPDGGPEDSAHGDHGSGERGTGGGEKAGLAANDTSARMPESRPEDSGLLGAVTPTAKPEGPQSLTRTANSSNDVSAQMPRSWRERPLIEERGRLSSAPTLFPVENERELSSTGDPSPPDIWISGHLGGPGRSTATAIAGQEKVGIAIDSSDPDHVLLVVAAPDGTNDAVVLTHGTSIGSLGDMLGRATVVGHNLKPAVAILHKHGIQPSRVFDTQLAWRLYDGHRHEDEGFFSLANARRALRTTTPALRDAREHLEEEAKLALTLATEFTLLLEEDRLQGVAELEFALVPVIAEMEAAGVPVDRAKWRSATDAWAKEAAHLRAELTGAMGATNIDNDKEVLAALRLCLGLPVEKTNGEALAPYRDNPIVEQLLRYRRLRGFITSAGEGVLRALDTACDGRVHVTIDQLGARTGRMSCKGPNLMGLPRDPEVRGCIAAPPGKKLIVGDYKAIEMRVIADLTEDEALRAVFESPHRCPHRHTASVLMRELEEQVTNEDRNHSKPINFGLSFGMSSKTLVTYARKNFNVVMTEPEAEGFKEKFLDHYKGIRDWQRKTLDEMRSPLRTRSGRTAYWENTEEGYNARLSFPVQGTAADGMKAAIVLLHAKLRGLDARIILAVHDELIAEASDENAEAVRVLMRECMVAGMRTFVPTVPIVVEPEIRSTWAE